MSDLDHVMKKDYDPLHPIPMFPQTVLYPTYETHCARKWGYTGGRLDCEVFHHSHFGWNITFLNLVGIAVWRPSLQGLGRIVNYIRLL